SLRRRGLAGWLRRRAATEHLAHVLEIELVRLGGLHEVAQLGDKPIRVVELGPVPGSGKLHQPAAGDPLSGTAPMLDRDDRVGAAPDEERWHALGEVEAIGGAYLLAFEVDDGAQRMDERVPRVAVGERGVAARRLGEIGLGLESE